ncbi:MAG TPA: septum formation initiator family protein [Candidatus Saccharimonadales bacterium]|nr:septum formation initiator family protein [Candidatus Saccharimonadales bacterium]
MLAKIKQYQTLASKEFARLKDLRTVGMLVFVAIVLLVSWSGVKAINTNYALQKQISRLQQQTAVQQLANDNLKLQNDYYNTPQYLELSARQDFGLAAPGETEWIVPQSVALAHTVALAQDAAPAAAAKVAKQSAIERHFHAWMDFFSHRSKH